MISHDSLATETPMAAETPSQRRLAKALVSLKNLQDSGLIVLRTSELSRDDREALVGAGFLKPIIKGWYMPYRPGESAGETTAWYAGANDFIARYCEERLVLLCSDIGSHTTTGSCTLPTSSMSRQMPTSTASDFSRRGRACRCRSSPR